MEFKGIGTPDLRLISGFDLINPEISPYCEVFICGGAMVYQQALPLCSDLYLTLVKRTVDGDAFFPPFEDRFDLAGVLLETPEFKILHYRNTTAALSC